MGRVRLFCIVAMSVACAFAVFAAGGAESSDEGTTSTTVVAGQYGEAPVLAELVSQGKLPPVDERLPKEPIVVKPYESIGEYGGTWRMWWDKTRRDWKLVNLFKYERMVRQKADLSYDVEADLADWWEVSADKREYTFHIREGLKWSDGHPFTTDDVEFFWNDVMGNETLRPAIVPRPPRVKPGTLEVIDTLTFKVVFEAPNGVFLIRDSLHGKGQRNRWHEFPKHYLSQFHEKYQTKEKLNEMVKEAKLSSWMELFGAKSDFMADPELPQMSMFVFSGTVGSGQQEIWKRNPFYYKVDTAGNQLPYIDEMSIELTPNRDIVTMRTIAGEFDYHIGSFRLNHYPMLKQNEASGPYKVDDVVNAKAGEFSLFINQTTSDRVLRTIFNDIRFRNAVSIALNREEIIEDVFWGSAEARQFSPVNGDPLYDAEMERAFTKYDPAGANKLLDEMGLAKRDSDGFRLRPDGQTLTVLFDWSTSRGWDDAYQLVKEYLEDVGIKIVSRGAERNVWTERANSHDSQISTWSVDASITTPTFLPSGNANWATAWEEWLATGGASGEKPPADVLRIKEILDTAGAAASPEEELKLLKEAASIHKKNQWIITIMANDMRPAVVHDRMKNVRMDAIPFNIYVPTPSGTSYPEQFWIDKNVPIK